MTSTAPFYLHLPLLYSTPLFVEHLLSVINRMKTKSKKAFNTVGTAAVVAMAVAVASASTQSSSKSSVCLRDPVLHRIHRGGTNPEPGDSAAPQPQISPEKPDVSHTEGSPKSTSSSSNKKKKSRASSSHSSETKPKGQSSDPQSHKKDQEDQHPSTPTPIQSYISTEKDLYHILGLHQQPRSSITSTDIQKAYRRRCLLTHPDKVPNGDQGAFDKVTEAFDILSDDKKRSLYDKYGLDAVQEGHSSSSPSTSTGMSSGGLGEEMFRQFFGGHPSMDGMRFFHSSRQQQQTKPKNRNLRYQLEISLEDMYTGSHQTVTISLPMSRSKKVLDVTIPRGIDHGQKVQLPGMVDSIADSTPADVIFVVVQRQHSIFTRKAHDLAMEVNLSLSEALTGFERVITHLDGRKIYIRGPMLEGSSTPRVIQSGDVHVLKGEGMPKRQRVQNAMMDLDTMDEKDKCEKFGDLYIQYKVDLPSSSLSKGTKHHMEDHLTMEERSTLRHLLNKLQGSTPVQIENKEHVSTLKTASPLDYGRARGPIESMEAEEEQEEAEDDSFRQGFQYFSSTGSGRSGFFSSSTASTDENGNVQCQQM